MNTDNAESTERDPRQQLFNAARQLHRHRTEIAKLEELKKVEVDRIEMWFADLASGELREIARLENEIQAWARENRTERTKSWQTPWGSVSTRERKGEVAVDDEAALVAWCEANDLIIPPKPQTPKPNVTELRKVAQLVDGLLVVDGEVVPGVHVEHAGDFNVSISIEGD